MEEEHLWEASALDQTGENRVNNLWYHALCNCKCAQAGRHESSNQPFVVAQEFPASPRVCDWIAHTGHFPLGGMVWYDSSVSHRGHRALWWSFPRSSYPGRCANEPETRSAQRNCGRELEQLSLLSGSSWDTPGNIWCLIGRHLLRVRADDNSTHPYNSWGFISIQWFYLALKNKIHILKYNTTHYKHNYIYQPIHPTIIHSFITIHSSYNSFIHLPYYSFIHHTIHSFIILFIHSSYNSLTHSLTHSYTHSTYDTYKKHLTQ